MSLSAAMTSFRTPLRVGQLCVFADPQAVVNAAAEMLGEMAVDVPADFVFAFVNVDDQFAHCG